MKIIKKGDYIRIAHTRTWPGRDKSDTADILDYGLLVVDVKDKEITLASHSSIFIIIKLDPVTLDKIMIDFHPKRTFIYEDGNMSNKSDVIWKVKSDRDDVILLVYNPRMEPDVTDDGTHFQTPTWDKLTKEDGEELTEEEVDTYSDDLMESLKELLFE